MMAADRLSTVKIPEKVAQPSTPGKEVEKRSDLPDFDSLLSDSSRLKTEEIEKEKAAAGGDLKMGESKTDKEFRDMLEKVTGKKQDKLKNKLEKDDYLNLMVTQLKYQDPTKPMENSEMATQLAQFNTVEQLMAANKTLGELKSQSSVGQVDKLTPYLGKVIEVKGDKMSIEKGKLTTEASFSVANAASSASVQVKDSQGSVVRSLGMGALEAGTHKIQFDGKDEKGMDLPSGKYSFQVVAASADGKPVDAISQIKVRVDGISDIAQGGKLETSGGNIDIKDILSIKAPTAAEESKVTNAAVPSQLVSNSVGATAAGANIAVPAMPVGASPASLTSVLPDLMKAVSQAVPGGASGATAAAPAAAQAKPTEVKAPSAEPNQAHAIAPKHAPKEQKVDGAPKSKASAAKSHNETNSSKSV
jgi:flagellar basal-body rod modification protein FlgD